jgi:hypothetical protein
MPREKQFFKQVMLRKQKNHIQKTNSGPLLYILYKKFKIRSQWCSWLILTNISGSNNIISAQILPENRREGNFNKFIVYLYPNNEIE